MLSHINENGLVHHFHILNPWCRIFFEKLIVTQLVKQQPAFFMEPEDLYHAHKSPPPDPILSQSNPVHPIDPYFPKVHLNVILLPMPRSSQCSLTFGPTNQNTKHLSSPPYVPHVPPTSSSLIQYPDNIW